jgi:hypothetical protein
MNGRYQVLRLQQRLKATLARTPHPTADIEVQADFAKYFCVLISGFLENALIALVLDVAQRRSAPEVALFVERQLDYWTNPTCEKITQLLGNFSPDWRIATEKHLVDERKDAVNSLVALRHKIVHGESVGTSLAQVKDYYTTVLNVIDFVANLVDPPVGGTG